MIIDLESGASDCASEAAVQPAGAAPTSKPAQAGVDGTKSDGAHSPGTSAEPIGTTSPVDRPAQKQGKKKDKNKKAAADTGAPAAASAQPSEAPPIQQADLRVAKVVSVEPVEHSEKLWRCQVDVGDAEPRQIVAGLQQHIPAESMTGMLCVAICNLKAAKLAGQVSQGMLLAASTPDKARVRTLQPPAGAQAGDRVFVEGTEPKDAAIAKVLKTKAWAEVAGELAAHDGCATHAKVPLVTAAGPCKLPHDIPDGSTIS